MLFSSLTFLLYFLPIFLITYMAIPNKYKNLHLFISSLIFYAWGEPIYVLLMIFSTINDFIFGRLIYKYRENKKKSTIFLICSIVINLSLLSFFKYSDFLIETINLIPNVSIPLLNIGLPIGISFYTFQTMSYSIDIYKGVSKPQKNIIDFGTYVALFPQLIAGPIVTYNQIEQDLSNKNRTLALNDGFSLFVIGLAKKVIFANNIGSIWETINALETSSIVGNWLGILCFGLQIYFDFSGYSDMAIGLGKMLGFHFPQNFNYPYISTSITDFWHRWHISLSSWFKTYVYIPLGGNRKGLKRQIINISIVWFLTGLWHGASYNFILWGVYFGILLIMEKTFLLKFLNKVPKVIQHIYALFFIFIGWVLFAIEDIQKLGIYLKGLFINNHFITNDCIFILKNNFVLILLCIIASIPIAKHIKIKKPIKQVCVVLLLLLSIITLVSSTYNPFLYFRF